MRFWVVVAVLTCVGCDAVFKLRDPTPLGDGPVFDANLVFVTNAVYPGNFGGIAVADAACMQAATDAGLSGSYVAWLSDSSVNASSRMPGSRGWIRHDGKPVIDVLAQLGTTGPIYPIALSETGDDVRTAGTRVWTGTNSSGGKEAARMCNDWTDNRSMAISRTGDAALGGGGFTNDLLDARCDLSNRFYCFGVGKNVQVFTVPSTGPVAFVTQGLWDPSSGIAMADTLCGTEAATAGLPGSFLAVLAQTGVTSASRFPPSQSYIRTDGVRIGPLLSSSLFEVPVNLTAGGQVVDPAMGVWTGGLPGEPGSDAMTCTNWSSGAGTSRGGDPHATDSRAFFSTSAALCSGSRHVYCLPL